ncbi:MAG: histidine kinase [Pseudomonadota bacterium]
MASIANHGFAPRDAVFERKIQWSEYSQALFVWAIYGFAQLFILPAVMPESWYFVRDAEAIFEVCFHGAIAACLAFPLKDWFLARQRYTLFAVVALAILLLAAVSLEFLINPLLFGSRVFPPVIYYIFIDGTSIALLLFAVRLLANRRYNERRLEALEKARAEAELQHLKAQINPHVLFNALNNIYSHALHKSDKTPELILKLADILRYMIYDCADDAVRLEKEIAFLSDYVDIQKMALDGRGSVDFRLQGDTADRQIAPFLLIPFVENCFKHSLDTLDQGIDIDIDVHMSDGRLQLECSNSFDPQAPQKPQHEGSQGIGLANVRRRLELLFRGDFTLNMSSDHGKYHVMLNVPVSA